MKLTYKLYERTFLDENKRPLFLINATSTKLRTNVSYLLSYPHPNRFKRFFYRTNFWMYEGQSATRPPKTEKKPDSIELHINRTLEPESALGPLLIGMKSSKRFGTKLILDGIPWVVAFLLLPLFIAMVASSEGRTTLSDLMKVIWKYIIP